MFLLFFFLYCRCLILMCVSYTGQSTWKVTVWAPKNMSSMKSCRACLLHANTSTSKSLWNLPTYRHRKKYSVMSSYRLLPFSEESRQLLLHLGHHTVNRCISTLDFQFSSSSVYPSINYWCLYLCWEYEGFFFSQPDCSSDYHFEWIVQSLWQ